MEALRLDGGAVHDSVAEISAVELSGERYPAAGADEWGYDDERSVLTYISLGGWPWEGR